MASPIGRTITGIEQDGWTWFLRLDDGTSVEFDVLTEYGEVEDVTLTHLTPKVIEARARAAEAERIADEEERRRNQEARERREAHIGEMREQLSPAAFAKWRRETYPSFHETLRDVWTSPALQEQLAGPPPRWEAVDG